MKNYELKNMNYPNRKARPQSYIVNRILLIFNSSRQLPIRKVLSFLLLFFLLSLPKLSYADDLGGRLRQLLPGDAPATVNERQFLYRELNELFRTLREEDRVSRKSLKKRVSRIEARLEKDFFRDYSGHTDLSETLRRGRYDDATASILYALAFEQFDVPYEGRIDHWESYVIADPEGRGIELRHPRTRKHQEAAERAFRREYLSLVRATVQPDMPSLSVAAADSLFYRLYYRPDRPLTFGQLAAYRQFRRAQSAYARKEFREAAVYLENALQRENRSAFLILAQATKLQLAALYRPEVEGDVNELFQQWNENPDSRYLPSAILQYFDDRQRLLLAERREIEAKDLLVAFRDRSPAGKEEWVAQIEKLQWLRLIAYYRTEDLPKQARMLAEDLYAAEPDNPAYRHVLGELLLGDLRLDNNESRQRADRLAQRYPFLKEQDRYADFLLRELALKVRDTFAREEERAGLLALAEFRQGLLKIPIDNDRNLWTLTAFLAASNYYFNSGNYVQARRYVEEGLKYGPEDDYLLHRRDVLRRY